MHLIKKNCPFCLEETYLKLSDEQHGEYTKYLEEGGAIQDALSLFNKFEREYIMTGYCPECQEKIFGSRLKKRDVFFKQSSLRKDVIRQFEAVSKRLRVVDAICSEYADMLNENEKLLYIYEAGLEDVCTINSDGRVIRTCMPN